MMLWKCCTQHTSKFGKLSSGKMTRIRSVFIPVPKKDNDEECSNYHATALISHASKIMLKILQARFQQYKNWKLRDVQAGFRKGRGIRDQIANICCIIKKARDFQKNIYFCFIDQAKDFDCVDLNKLEGLILKLKLQYFGHLMRRANSLEKLLMLGKIEGRRRMGWQRMRWLDGIIGSMNMNLSKLWEIVDRNLACYSPWSQRVWHKLVIEQQQFWILIYKTPWHTI